MTCDPRVEFLECATIRKGELYDEVMYDGKLYHGRGGSDPSYSKMVPVMWFGPSMVGRTYGQSDNERAPLARCVTYVPTRPLKLFAMTSANLRALLRKHPWLGRSRMLRGHDAVRTEGYSSPENMSAGVYRSMRMALDLGDVLGPLGFDGWIVLSRTHLKRHGRGTPFHSEICLFRGFGRKIRILGTC